MNPLKYQITNESVMVVVDGEPHTVNRTQPNYADLRAALIAEERDKVLGLLTVGPTVEAWADGEFTVVGGHVCYQNEPLPRPLNARILKMVGKGDDPRPLMRFWERLDENPSYRSRLQLFDFLMQHPGIPFTPDGFVLLYKGVRGDFRDCHSGKFDNSPGQKLFMKRNRVSDDPAKACHFGFHVGARSYASSFGARSLASSFGNGQTVICKVDPADVVCVPNDCGQAKVRIHRYEVVGVDGGGLLPDTNFHEEPLVAPVDPKEPLAAPVGKHTDGSPLEPGETQPKSDDEDATVVLPLTGTEWDHLNDRDSVALMDLRITTLRAYARFNCLIIGASKMRGGKALLVPAICKARGYADPPEPVNEPEQECEECGGDADFCGC